jgi:hypothetical protein
MALPTLDLDDLTYQQLLDILRGHLPVDEWTDHNPSDPGIALLELLSWLGEMDLYRMNRVPAAHRNKFLKLLVDPPVPVTVRVTLRLDPPRAPGGGDLVLPPGLRAASDFRRGRRTVFESFARAVLPASPAGKDQVGEVAMRAVRDLGEVVLGTSDGSANQTFAIPDGPVLLDLATRTPDFNPNPRVRVDGDEWELRPFLLIAGSRAPALVAGLPQPAPRHFMVDELEGRVRFGDGVFGAIPPAGAIITLAACRVLEGPDALVAEGEVRHLLNPEIASGLAFGESLHLLVPEDLVGSDRTGKPSSDAEGGEGFFSAGERLQRGLAEFRNPTRLVTAGDFERVATDDFNRFQDSFNRATGRPPGQDLVRRVVALMNRKPPLLDAAATTAPGHVTLMIVPAYDEAELDAASFARKVELTTPPVAQMNRLLAYLEPRRIITTRLHVVGPQLAKVTAAVVVVIDAQRNAAQMEAAVTAMLRRYLSIARGYDDGRGWPLGRRVRRSQIFRLLEDVPGVDHVESLALGPADGQGDVEVGPGQLPVWDSLAVQIKRA